MQNQESNARVDLWVFRDGRKSLLSSSLVNDLVLTLQSLQRAPEDDSAVLDALIRAGELEAALADSGLPCASDIAVLTDALAAHLVDKRRAPQSYEQLIVSVQQLELPYCVSISPPEGFSYYSLNPKDFIGLARDVCKSGDAAAVIGIRSIGITLSAIVAATLSTTNLKIERLSVRPTGHPYDRELALNPNELHWIRRHLQRGSRFLVVDEGPGRSGSTFLSVAEGLVNMGVGEHKIALLGTRHANASDLCTKDAASRWNRFRFYPVEARSSQRFHGFTYAGGGEWRKTLIPDENLWPACWPQMERSKFFSPDGYLYKFEGMGRIGQQVRERARLLAESGFSPEFSDGGDGFTAYRFTAGRPLTRRDADEATLEQLARYCAMRASEFKVSNAQVDPLVEMVEFNLQQELGVHCDTLRGDLAIGDLIIADGRMQPHEWLYDSSGKLLKTDGVSHGDDHFFPGPSDIAWDLAGIIVEWDLSQDAADFLLRRFAQLSGRNLESSTQAFCLAYATFRMSMCSMALPTTRDHNEVRRLQRDHRRYRVAVQKHLSKLTDARAPEAGTQELRCMEPQERAA